MRFRRVSDGLIVDAKAWKRQGDHPRVRPATKSDFPASSEPGQYGWIDGYGLVLPEVFIIEDGTGSIWSLPEGALRRAYEPIPSNDEEA